VCIVFPKIKAATPAYIAPPYQMQTLLSTFLVYNVCDLL